MSSYPSIKDKARENATGMLETIYFTQIIF